MSFSSNAKALADRLIKKYGDSVVLVERVLGGYDPTTGKDQVTLTNYSRKGQVTNYSVAEMSSDNITVDDLQVIVRVDLDITRDWTVTYANKSWKIIDIVKIRTQDNTVIHKLQIRV